MRTLRAFGIAAVLLGALDARAADFQETASVRFDVAQARSVSPNDVGLGPRFTVAAAVRPWRLLEVEGDLGIVTNGGTAGLRAGVAYPFLQAAARFQLDGVLVGGYRAMEGLDVHPAEVAPEHPGLPVATLLHAAEAKAALDGTLWASPAVGVTVRLFVGALVAPWAPYIGVAPELGAAGGVAF